MGFTIEDMLSTTGDQYKMSLVAGNKGWSNSISWIMMIEDTRIIQNYAGKEMVVTTGLGFGSKDKLMNLAHKLVESHASGLMINVGEYIMELPEELIEFCDANDLPLITMPWEIIISDMIKDISMRIFLQGTADEQISNAMILAINSPELREEYASELMPYFDVDGVFEVIIVTADGLDQMDTVYRRRLSNRLQIYLENITHNGNFFYYDGDFVLVMNDVHKGGSDEIIDGMIGRAKRRLQEEDIYTGIGSRVNDISKLHISYKRAKAAVAVAKKNKESKVKFDQMGINRLLYSVSDESLLEEMMTEPLAPLLEYDKKHDSNYVETLEIYLQCNGSIQAVSELMYTHRNTIIYRVNNIKKLLDCDLDTMEDKVKYLIALKIRNM